MISLEDFLNDGDWSNALEFGGKPSEDCYTSATDTVPPSASPVTDKGMDCSPFNMDDVAEVLHAHEGMNDGEDWLCVVLLKDGRYAYVEAWCDYTGWG